MFEMQFPRWTQVTSHKKIVRGVIATTGAFMGIINGLTALLPSRQGRLELLIGFFNQIAPFAPSVWRFTHAGRTLALILGFFLCIVAVGLARGKRRAWQFALILFPLSVFAHIVKGLDVEEAVLAMLLWLGLFSSRAFFCVESDPRLTWRGIVLLLLGFMLLLVYSIGGFYLLQAQFLTSRTSIEDLRLVLGRVVNLPAPELLPLTRHASWFLQSIPWLSAAALLTGMFILLRPVSARWWIAYQKERPAQMRHQTAELICNYGDHTLTFFALDPENLCYLAPGGEGIVNYRLTSNVAVALGDPICTPGAFERVMQGFLDFCSLQDWRVVIFQAHPEYLAAYHKLGLHALKLGEEAFIYPQTFSLAGSAMANVRTSYRRAEREGVNIQWFEGVPPKEVMAQLQQLSLAWLECKGGKHAVEMGFSMGRFVGLAEDAKRAESIATLYWSRGDMPGSKVPRLVTGVAIDHMEQPCAFVTFTPIYGSQGILSAHSDHLSARWGWATDLMRRATGAPPGIIELLIVRAIERFRVQGAAVLSLGVVALSDTRQEMPASQRRAESFVIEHLRLLETHRSLSRFKQKFHPSWESRYMVTNTMLSLPRTALAVLRVHQS